MKRTASMSLDWERDEYGSYIAQLPSVPGYPGTWYATVDHFTGISTAGDWHLTISNRPNPTVFLYKDIPGIVFHAKTPEELMNIVEERLTPEMIAQALQAEGYMPNDFATASRKADKRTAHFDLDWEKYYNSHGAYYEAELPSVPGYTAPGYMTSTIVWGSVDDPNLWTFLISLAGIDDGRMPTLSTVQLNAEDFGIPDAETPEEMMQAVENLNMDDIIFVLQQEGCQPYEED